MSRLLVCYISGLDRRRIRAADTPCLAGALASGRLVGLRNLPGNELFPTLVTGVPPPLHGVWGVKLADRKPSFADRWTDLLPDGLTTTLQCVRHWADRRYDLAAVPPRRRRRLLLTRTKYKRRTLRAEALFRIGGMPTVFDVVGEERSRYRYCASYEPRNDLLPLVGRGDLDLEVVELYSLDRHQQWNLDREDETRRFHGVVDDFLAQLAVRASANGIAVMVLSDHGHERIREAIDLRAAMKRLGIGSRHADWFTEVSNVRFWLHDDGARRALVDWLGSLGKGTLLSWEDMRAQGVALTDGSFGELFYYLDPGHIFFPHDFHHPLANVWLGISDRLQRARLRDPRHRGNHGHLAHFEAERAFAVMLHEGFRPLRTEGHLVDVAPTMLALTGRAIPPSMPGSPFFAATAASWQRPGAPSATPARGPRDPLRPNRGGGRSRGGP